ncbi:hypothetical protein BDY21DRAFT_77867 [Lineolata rhizophorae]|uniref:DUF2415 domain-containing protein n=1 Tax=Lineolata rhizophorae TaxID=578093 RepID=A0A6A6NTJ4_9PEZI|nr:hypothetical protein BDY21DRAFT_77867 [Lineolata rhizophorae]
MAADDFLSYETENLILPSRNFYPLSIPVSHYQLRHFISSPEPDILYYASGRDVYRLNTTTRDLIHVAELPFEARCTSSGYGWICVGGEDSGLFAIITLNDAPSISHNGRPVTPSFPRPGLRVERIGSQIVNSISVHKIPGSSVGPGRSEEDEVVAVLTNNDQTMRIYSLTHEGEAARIDFPFPMNHASISPDGRLLVAVGDSHVAYFFERRDRPGCPADTDKPPATKAKSAASTWQLLRAHTLYLPKYRTACATGYFTTAWSPSGSLVAVGAEAGYITVFDSKIIQEVPYAASNTIASLTCSSADHIKPYINTARPRRAKMSSSNPRSSRPEKPLDDIPDAMDAEVKVIASTRPYHNTGPGAVRCMLFSPSPWDLLIWAEDQGRVCVSDLRDGLTSRQVLDLHLPGQHEEQGQDQAKPAPDVRFVQVNDITAFAEDQRVGEDAARETGQAVLNGEDLRDEEAPDPDLEPTQRANIQELRRLRGVLMRRYHAPIRTTRIAANSLGWSSRNNFPTGYHRTLLGELTSEEQQILDGLREGRLREEARAARQSSGDENAGPQSANYGHISPPPASPGHNNSGGSGMNIDTDFPALTRTSAAPATPPEPMVAVPSWNPWYFRQLNDQDVRDFVRLVSESQHRTQSDVIDEGGSGEGPPPVHRDVESDDIENLVILDNDSGIGDHDDVADGHNDDGDVHMDYGLHDGDQRTSHTEFNPAFPPSEAELAGIPENEASSRNRDTDNASATHNGIHAPAPLTEQDRLRNMDIQARWRLIRSRQHAILRDDSNETGHNSPTAGFLSTTNLPIPRSTSPAQMPASTGVSNSSSPTGSVSAANRITTNPAAAITTTSLVPAVATSPFYRRAARMGGAYAPESAGAEIYSRAGLRGLTAAAAAAGISVQVARRVQVPGGTTRIVRGPTVGSGTSFPVGFREEDGVRTAGLAWGAAGNSLWVGCEEGLWEMKVDTFSRKGMEAWSVC